jgi:sulfate transport system permease protein
MRWNRRRPSRRTLPGFGLSLGFAMTCLSLIVLLPLAALVVESARMGWQDFWQVVSSTQVVAAYRLTIGTSALSAAACVVIGLLVAYVLARYSFPGKRLADAVIDLPFALPTAVAGIALTFLYSERGWIGGALKRAGFAYPWPGWRGFSADAWCPVEWTWYERVSLAPLGIVVALTFVGLPFVVRTVQPVLQDLGRELEEAAASLGASRWQTFRKVILPQATPALLTGFTLAFARGLGEYGSVIFIAGKRQDTEIAAHKIIEYVLNYEERSATAVAVVLLAVSFVLLLLINALQRRLASRGAEGGVA